MLRKLLKYKGELGVATLILGGIIVLGWFTEVKITEQTTPFYHRIMSEFKLVNHEFKQINGTLIRLNDKIDMVQKEAKETNLYVRGRLSNEVQANAENKVGYPEFWHTDDVMIEALGVNKGIEKKITLPNN